MSDPKDIFKKFGQSARHILVTSQRIAQNAHSGIGSEHLLMALTVTAGNIAYEILKENAINLEQVKLTLSLNNIRTNINEGLSKEVKDLLAAATKKASSLKHSSIEAEHLLWAITSAHESLAYQIIKRMGVDPQGLQEQLEDVFNEMPLINSMNKFMENNLGLFNIGPMSSLGNFTIPGMPDAAQRNNITSQTPYLDQYGLDLTKRAKESRLDPVIGREMEIARCMQILSRRTKNNPVLVGEPGVGKTAIVEGLAQRIFEGKVPISLRDRRIINLDLSMTVAGTMYRGQFEDRIKKIINEIIKVKNIILFIDELHTVVGAGSAEGSMDAANILKPALAKGNIHLIGATTIEEYRKHIEKDAALERRLQVVKVNEPSKQETIKILQGVRQKYEEYHRVKITDEAIAAATELSSRYISDRHLPDKAIDLIDEAAAAKQIISKFSEDSQEVNKLSQELKELVSQKEKAVANQDYQLAAQLKTGEIKLSTELNKLKSLFIGHQEQVERNDIAQVVSLWTGIPLENLIESDKKRFLDLEKRLKEKIIGQDDAIRQLAQATRRAKSGVANPLRPIGAFIFLGPTGVGKTELAKVLANEVFIKPESLVKIDMSEFMEKHTISRLVGAPPGYIGYEDAGKLTEAIRRNPYSVILLDEIEKAHPEVFNLLLQILEDGYLTDAKGRRVNFRNTIIIMTSNIGVGELNRQAAIGFQAKTKNQKQAAYEQYNQMKDTVLEQLKKEFRPELLNRLDKIIVFKPLDRETIGKISNLQVQELKERLGKQKIRLDVDKSVEAHIAKLGYDPKYGARSIRRMVADLIENPVSDLIIAGIKNRKIKVSFRNGKIKLTS